MKIGFIGQGYIGKNYADDFENRGFKVIRYSKEKPYIENKEKIKECDIVFIAVPTPTTPRGFDDSIVREAVKLVPKGKIAVIKSTIVPGTTKDIQSKNGEIVILYSPEFLSEATASYDASHPFSNIIGLAKNTSKHKKAAKLVHSILPKANFSQTCTSTEAETIKYAHNISGYSQIITFNVFYDFAKKLGCDWENIQKAIQADPMVCNRYSKPIHKSGRGAGGHCFIKDLAAFHKHYEGVVGNKFGLRFLEALRDKNIHLLTSTGKDLDLLIGVYGNKVIKRKK